MIRLIGFSGPPRSGKDTIGNMLAELLHDAYPTMPIEVHALSLPMRLSTYALLGLTYSLEHYEANKDSPIKVPGRQNTTIRAEMIALSESHVKQRLGHGWWGRALLNRCPLTEGVIIVTDMGFPSEVEVFESRFDRRNCAWVHLYRKGHTFVHDSRSIVGEYKPIKIHNDGTMMGSAATILSDLNARWSF